LLDFTTNILEVVHDLVQFFLSLVGLDFQLGLLLRGLVGVGNVVESLSFVLYLEFVSKVKVVEIEIFWCICNFDLKLLILPRLLLMRLFLPHLLHVEFIHLWLLCLILFQRRL
jgi:hypothetical protein